MKVGSVNLNELKVWLVALSLLLIPLYELWVRVFPNILILTPDTRVTKELLCLIMAFLIGLLAFCSKIVPVKNYYILAFLFFLIISFRLSPKFPLEIEKIDNSSVWLFRDMFYAVVYFLLFISVSSLNITQKHIDLILKCLMYSSAICALYAIYQQIGLDQFWDVKTEKEFVWVSQKQIVGTLGQPTIVAPFLAIGVLLSYSYKKWIFVLAGLIALLCTQSMVAIVAFLITVFAMISLNKKEAIPLIAVILIIFAALSFSSLDKSINPKNIFKSNGRFDVWQKTWKDFRDNPIENIKGDYSITGTGLGTFGYLWTPRNKSSFRQAHNDFLEILWGVGIVGFTIFIAAWIEVIRFALRKFHTLINVKKWQVFIIASVFFYISICCLGTFLWQLGVYQFITVVCVGLIYNDYFNEKRRNFHVNISKETFKFNPIKLNRSRFIPEGIMG